MPSAAKRTKYSAPEAPASRAARFRRQPSASTAGTVHTAPAGTPVRSPGSADAAALTADAGFGGSSGEKAPAGLGPPASPASRKSPRARVPAWWPIPLCLAVGAAGGAVYASVAEAQFAASAYVMVSAGQQADSASALGYAQAYGKIATDPVILAAAERRARVAPGTLTTGAKASTSPDAPMVEITYTAGDSAKAAEYANAVAQALVHTAEQPAKRTGTSLTVFSGAEAPDSSVSPSAPAAVSVGGCAGGLLGGLVLLARPQRHRRSATDAAVPAPVHEGDAADALPNPAREEPTAHREPRP